MSKQRKLELSHDVLAEKIWAKLPENDRRLREAKASLLRRYQDYQIGKAELLDKKFLDAYREAIRQLRPEVEEAWAFYEASEQALKDEEKAANLRVWWTRIAAIVMGLLAIVAVVAFFWASREQQKAKALNEELNDTVTQLEDREDQLSDQNQELVRRDSQLQASLAAEQVARDTATLNLQKAVAAEYKRARTAANTVPILLRQADQQIRLLDYDSALVFAQRAWDLDALRPTAALRFQEIAYWYNETGAHEQAARTLTYIGRQPHQLSPEPERAAEQLATALRAISPDHHATLVERYYSSEFILVQGGTFTMGCVEERDGRCSGVETPPHPVTLDSFHLARTETTVWQYALYCRQSGQDSLSRIQDGLDWVLAGNIPIVRVSWWDAVRYCNWLSEQAGYQPVYTLMAEDSIVADWAANGFRLPTEAEWEYAARSRDSEDKWAGTSNEDELPRYVNYETQEDGFVHTAPVGSLQPNGLGLYDMSGNVWEWCWDWFGNYPEEEQVNPRGPMRNGYRVLRGGAWNFEPQWSRVASRFRHKWDGRGNTRGFRLARN